MKQHIPFGVFGVKLFCPVFFTELIERNESMYKLITEAEFDSAHFLKGYPGKCANIHGHRWRVICEIGADKLQDAGAERGMLVDFSTLKKALKGLADTLDHQLIYEAGALKPGTIAALQEEGFGLLPLPFTPTAENMAKYLYDAMTALGFPVTCLTVYETPNNAAAYTGA